LFHLITIKTSLWIIQNFNLNKTLLFDLSEDPIVPLILFLPLFMQALSIPEICPHESGGYARKDMLFPVHFPA
jgi:hypothetical protein